MRGLILLVVMLVAGCGSMVWGKNGDIYVDSSRDRAQCEYETNSAVAGIRSGIQAGFQQVELMKLCMQARGYQQYYIQR
jgi:hypothetical protein